MPKPNDRLSQIRQLLQEVPLVDGHNDLPWQFRHRNKEVTEIDLAADTSRLTPPLLTDIPRLRAGGVGAQYWSIYVPAHLPGPAAVRASLEQIDLVHQLVALYPATLEFAISAAEIERIHRSGKIASLMGIEGGHCIDNSLAVLRTMFRLGARYLTLTHVRNTDWADAAGDEPKHHGLTGFGEQVVHELNRLGMMVDLSHVADETMRAALRVSRAPVIFSHSSARAVCQNARNVPDDILRDVRQNGGIVMACFLPGYLNNQASACWALATAQKKRLDRLYPDVPEKVDGEMEQWYRANPFPPATLQDVANHIDHLRKVVGTEHIGIGSDFEGYFGTVKGLEDVSCYPMLFAELLRRGYSIPELKQIAGLNFLRVFRDVERVAARLQHSR